MGRAPCCDKANVKRGPWSPEEDAKLKDYIDKNGTGGNWIALPQKAGLRRCGKSCRLRWLNYLRPNIKHGEFSDDEDRIICTLFATIGSRWSIIAAQLPGRTDNDIKNYWNTKLKKKLLMASSPSKPPNNTTFSSFLHQPYTPYDHTHNYTCAPDQTLRSSSITTTLDLEQSNTFFSLFQQESNHMNNLVSTSTSSSDGSQMDHLYNNNNYNNTLYNATSHEAASHGQQQHIWGATQTVIDTSPYLDHYGLEEIKELISNNNNNNFLLDL